MNGIKKYIKLIKNLYVYITGHNTDGKYFVTSNKLSFKCETVPRKVNVFIEKGRDGQVSPVTDVEIRDVAAGINHSVSCSRK